MGLIWDWMQSSEISEQRQKAKSLEKRIQRLEDELLDTRGLVYLLLQELRPNLPRVQAGPPLRPINVRIVGTNDTSEDGLDRREIIKQCQIGEQLNLLHVAEGPHDLNVVVVRKSGERLGYLPRDLAEEIAPRLEVGSRVDAEIAKITGGGWLFRKPYEVSIKITKYRSRHGT